MGKERASEYYDKIYATSAAYAQPYQQSRYWPLWHQIIGFLEKKAFEIGRKLDVLEVGCGTGQLAEAMKDSLLVRQYAGFDFSNQAVVMASKRFGPGPHEGYMFFKADALTHFPYSTNEYDVVVATEVFEHIERDQAILKMIPSGKLVIITVPDFDDPAHVRHFKTEAEVLKRYTEQIDFVGPGHGIFKISRWFLAVGVKR